ncbi:hypothetical protein [Curtobacterium sp. MCPF17_046]|uniref:hypothetical protein n=1 Tax=Curtobacterium sp. MCPF17_046 TaxID=2175663 RepID=UPI0015E8C039|nr:hypothetical protein [Curtobacterium sp. MCPF17_046]
MTDPTRPSTPDRKPNDRSSNDSGSGTLSRRGVVLGGAAAVAAAAVAFGTPGIASAAPARAASAATAGHHPGRPVSSRIRSRDLAYDYLDLRMDEYGTGTAPRLPRSYSGGYFATLPSEFVSSFAYDDSLMVLAWLARRRRGDVQRATALGDALLALQAADPIGDGRTRASYQPDSFPVADPPRPIDVGSPASYTGNQSWVGMAFCRLYAVTRQRRFLDGALRLGTWIETNARDDVRRPAGYTGGRNANDQPITYKSTEHNIDVTGFFTQLAQLTGDRTWARRAALAESFVRAMQDPTDGHLWTGTDPDGTTINRTPIPEDVQTWAYLATLDRRYSPSVTWVLDHLTAHDGPYTGPSFSDTDVSKVWFEGSGHLALALEARGARGDRARAAQILDSVQLAQATEPNGDGKGIVSASSDGLDTGFGDLYYASLHTGATAWYLLALTRSNPFRL